MKCKDLPSHTPLISNNGVVRSTYSKLGHNLICLQRTGIALKWDMVPEALPATDIPSVSVAGLTHEDSASSALIVR